ALRLAGARQVPFFIAKRGEAAETFLVALPVEEVRISNGHVVHVFGFLGDEYEPFRLLERRRSQQHRVDHAEDRRVRTDAERERENGDGSKSRVLSQLAPGESKIIHNAKLPLVRVSRLLPRLGLSNPNDRQRECQRTCNVVSP